MPEQGNALILCHRLRIAVKRLEFIKIDASDAAIQLQFTPKVEIDPMKLINLLQRDKRCRMNGSDKLRITVQLGDVQLRADFIKTLLKEFI